MAVSITVSAQRGGHASLLALATAIRAWKGTGEGAALARLVATSGSTPRPAGSMMAVSARGELAGSIVGGCVEAAVAAAALGAIESGSPPAIESFGYSDMDALGIGLSCGGSVQVLIEPVAPSWLDDVAKAIEERLPIAVVTAVGGGACALGASLCAGAHGVICGSLGDPSLDELALAAARAALAGDDGDSGDGAGVDPDAALFVQALLGPPRLVLVGAVDVAAALGRVGALLGYEVIVIDPRAAFATPARFPGAERVVASWPDRVLKELALNEHDAVCVLTHDHKVDVPALAVALAGPARYVGALGSRATNRERLALLAEAGVADAALERLRAPIGLGLGARGPDEIAVAIAAELVAVRNRHPAPFLRDGSGPLHAASGGASP